MSDSTRFESINSSMHDGGILLSIVVPTWNTADYLGRMLESIRPTPASHQFEVIIVDDGSTDHTKEVVDRWIDRLPIRYFALEHRGVSAARNAALEVAEGTWVSFVDSDDVLLERWTSTVTSVLMDSPAVDVLSWGTEVWGLDGSKKFHLPSGGPSLEGYSPVFTAGSIAYRSALLREIGGYDEDLMAGTHTDLWRRFSKAGFSSQLNCVALSDVLYRYVKRKGSVSSDSERWLTATRKSIEEMKLYESSYSRSDKSRLFAIHAVHLRRTGEYVAAIRAAMTSVLFGPNLKALGRLAACLLGPIWQWIEKSRCNKLGHRKPHGGQIF